MIKKIECVIKPHKLDDVKMALIENGIQGMTIWEVRGFGRQKGHSDVYRGSEYRVDFVPKVKIEIFIRSEDLDTILNVIQKTARTGGIVRDRAVFEPGNSRSPAVAAGRIGRQRAMMEGAMIGSATVAGGVIADQHAVRYHNAERVAPDCPAGTRAAARGRRTRPRPHGGGDGS